MLAVGRRRLAHDVAQPEGIQLHPQLADIVSSQFYGDALQTALSTKRMRTRRWSVVFVGVKGEEERRGTSFLNRQEIAAVMELFKQECFVNPTQTVRVICFHKPQFKGIQCALVTRGLLDEKDAAQSSGGPQTLLSHLPTLDASTVDAMQGREADVVILSRARTHDHDVGFLANDNRVNVALSRAEQVLYVVGNATALSTNATWRDVLQHQHVTRETKADCTAGL